MNLKKHILKQASGRIMIVQKQQRKWHVYTIHEGFSLVELMLAMVIFAVIALALNKGILQSHKMATNSIYMTSAYAVAYGYAEQIMATDYEDLLASVKDPLVPLNLKAVSPMGGGESDDLLYLNINNERDIIIDIRDDADGSERAVAMPMQIWIEASDMDRGVRPYKSLEIKIRFDYKSPLKRKNKWVREHVHFVKSAVPSY